MEEEDSNSPLLAKSAEINEAPEGETELAGCGASLPCDPHRRLHRYLVLVVMCFLSFGSYFCYDNPASLQAQMKEDLDISTSQFMAFYSWYSWPNVILCFFGGFLIDRVFGIRLGAIIFASFVTVGQLMFALGAFLDNYWLMNMARFVFGIGGESLCVAQNTYAVTWFKERELNMVFGLQLSFSRVGSTVNMVVMTPLYNALDQYGKSGPVTLGFSLLIAASFCLLSLFCALYLGYLDKRAARILRREEGKTGEVIKLSDVRYFGASVWLLCVICVAYYVTVFPFIGLGLVFFERKFGLSPAKASAVNSIVYILSAVASPLFGFLIDRTGRNIIWVFTGCLITLGCHALMAFTFLTPYVPMVVMGFAYSILASALWPMAAYIVPEHQLGTAYGLMQAIQNLGLAVISLVSGTIVDKQGYLVLEVFFLGCLSVALLATSVLFLLDAARGGELNLSASQRKKLLAERKLLSEEVTVNS